MSEEERRREIARKHGIPLERITERTIKKGQSIHEAMVPPKPTPPKAFVETKSLQEVIEDRYKASIARAEEMRDERQDLTYNLEALPKLPRRYKEGERKTQRSVHMSSDNRLGRQALIVRPSFSKNIIEECKTPIKLHISQHQSPGDLVMLSAVIRDLHEAYPDIFITEMHTPCMSIWENNPNHTIIGDTEDAMWLVANYPLVNTSNSNSYHFVHGFRKYFEKVLGIKIPLTAFKGDIHLSEEELFSTSKIKQILGKDVPYWIINAGYKTDYTAKMWEFARYQQVVADNPDITFVQVGEQAHVHKPLQGGNVINLVGQTDMREFIQLMYNAAGVITPVSLAMHLSAAIPAHPRFKRRNRPCIVIAGGREPVSWEAYPTHQYLHTVGMLPCCEAGGCWKSRTEPLKDNNIKDNSLCSMPVAGESGQVIPKCLDMITAEEVSSKLQAYNKAYEDLKDE